MPRLLSFLPIIVVIAVLALPVAVFAASYPVHGQAGASTDAGEAKAVELDTDSQQPPTAQYAGILQPVMALLSGPQADCVLAVTGDDAAGQIRALHVSQNIQHIYACIPSELYHTRTVIDFAVSVFDVQSGRHDPVTHDCLVEAGLQQPELIELRIGIFHVDAEDIPALVASIREGRDSQKITDCTTDRARLLQTTIATYRALDRLDQATRGQYIIDQINASSSSELNDCIDNNNIRDQLPGISGLSVMQSFQRFENDALAECIIKDQETATRIYARVTSSRFSIANTTADGVLHDGTGRLSPAAERCFQQGGAAEAYYPALAEFSFDPAGTLTGAAPGAAARIFAAQEVLNERCLVITPKDYLIRYESIALGLRTRLQAPTLALSGVCASGGAVADAANNPGLAADCEALLAARDNMQGAGGLNWAADLPIDDWDGVTVTDPEDARPGEAAPPLRVIRLKLEGMGLSGAIPAELSYLHALEHLQLGHNELSGRPPGWISGLAELHVLDLRNNRFTGQLPTWVWDVTTLRDLHLESNHFTGSIPPEIGNLVNLRHIHLEHNQLTGSIPEELGNLTGLIGFDFSDNRLTGPIPDSVGNMRSLFRLDLRHNLLSGPLPSWIGNFPRMFDLHLEYNRFTGPIPPEIGNLRNMAHFHLNNNQLTGEIPAEIGNLTELFGVDFSHNQLTGPVPPELGGLPELFRVAFNDNWLSGPVPAELGDMPELGRLLLHNNQLEGPIPAELGDAASLWELRLENNLLTGPIPASLGGLENMQRMDLNDNRLSGAIPPELGNLTSMVRLHLERNQLEGAIPAELGMLEDLEELYLSENRLTGTIPPELGNLGNLLNLYLKDNQLEGAIPAELSWLTDLQHLYLDRNRLSGGIPPELGNLSDLTHLYLSENRLTGTIPVHLGQLTELERLYLDRNRLTGFIPTQFGNLSKLRRLRLWANKLSGPIPVELARLTELRSLHLDSNQLSGPIPPQLGNLRNLRELWLWANKLSGPIPQELGLLTELRQLALDYNELTGEIPRELTNLANLLALYLAGNDDLSGCVPPELRAVHVNDLDMLEIPFCDLVLSSLTVSPGVLEPPFDPYHARYSVTVDEPRITVAVTSAHNVDFQLFDRSFAPIPDADPETVGHQVDLAFGLNRIFLEVTSQDGDATDYYIIEVVYAVGSAPAFPGDQLERSVTENTPTGQPVGEPVAAEDADGDSLTYTLGGADAGLFEIDGATGQIMVGPGTMLDYETRTSYMVEVTADDGNENSATAEVTITVTDVDPGTPYDRDNNEVIDQEEALAAVTDYFAGLISQQEALVVIALYFQGGQGIQATTAGVPASAGMTNGEVGMTKGEAGVTKGTEATGKSAPGQPGVTGATPGADDDVLSSYMEQRNGPGVIKDRD